MKINILSILSISLLGSVLSTAQASPSVVGQLEIGRYLGTWYEIASVKPPFQQGCACVTAEYALNEDQSVQVINSCRQGGSKGEVFSVKGVALPTEDPAKFIVSFAGPVPVEANYWVVDLDEDYGWAVVSGPTYTPFWILSRTPSLDPVRFEDIRGRLGERGFDLSALVPTLQEGCWAAGQQQAW